jgi:hypothetical protein
MQKAPQQKPPRASASRCAVIEPLESRIQFNAISAIMAIIGAVDAKSVQSQPGGYDPKIGLLPFTQR